MTYCVELPFFCPWVSEGVIRSYSRVCEYYKTTFVSFEWGFLDSVLQPNSPDCNWFRFWISAALWEPCGPLFLVWPLWSQHARLSPALSSMYVWFLWCQWKGTNNFFLQGNGVATFNGQRLSQKATKESFLVIVEIVEMQQIFASKNLELATVYDFSFKASVIRFSFLYCWKNNEWHICHSISDLITVINNGFVRKVQNRVYRLYPDSSAKKC